MAEVTKKLSGREYSAILSLFSAVSHYTELYPMLRKRAEMVPGTTELMEQVSEGTSEVIDRILGTVPPEKLRQLQADIKHVKLYIKVEPPGCVPTIDMTSYSYVPTKALNALLAHVMENECLVCDKTPEEARKCEYRRLIEKTLVHEVDAVDTEHCKYSDMVVGVEREDKEGST